MREEKELIKIADEDLESAKYLYNFEKFRTSIFHSQQAVEKYLKAFLLYKVGEYSFTHSIYKLLVECIKLDRDFEELEKLKLQKK